MGAVLELAATIYTIGHSNHAMVRFADLLQGAGIACVADVRSVPLSRRNPHFSQKPLAAALKDVGIDYWYLGDALGARPKDPAMYDDGYVSFRRMAAGAAFQTAIDALIERACGERVAIMCAEKDPTDCHRTILVSRALAQRACAIQHVLANGSLLDHAAVEDQLLHRAKESVDLFGDRAAALDRAYDRLGSAMTRVSA